MVKILAFYDAVCLAAKPWADGWTECPNFIPLLKVEVKRLENQVMPAKVRLSSLIKLIFKLHSKKTL
jgi:hypothetical protein